MKNVIKIQFGSTVVSKSCTCRLGSVFKVGLNTISYHSYHVLLTMCRLKICLMKVGKEFSEVRKGFFPDSEPST